MAPAEQAPLPTTRQAQGCGLRGFMSNCYACFPLSWFCPERGHTGTSQLPAQTQSPGHAALLCGTVCVVCGRPGGCEAVSLGVSWLVPLLSPLSFWDWEKGEKLDYFHNGNPRYTRVTAMEYLNGQDCSLLLTATGEWVCTPGTQTPPCRRRDSVRPQHASCKVSFDLDRLFWQRGLSCLHK